ncbi:hypothetical protein SELMODRAFT_150230 [Selaginella moellendorffii]|uniref:BI1-like protein n=1 Tax=Selaginella moellendorffii TaxID=88036 RepID=D8RV78_SELML|nr:BI1-like protein isoform X2 [Selaginella moellendorffii]XP_002977530.1 BI1-like protein [Selaginella moellendorffii]EFJ21534.1 hypothetical protein SELMODRAFT_151868 [Selaginella moellendorffii]EFJ23912.1 hypothetical protein SELMODRAFT_150230 [Selaginella moellendorffii]|eukprot:XP_002975127.1 BI1-like protein isoform X2 [Selaginella moellendorffii]
MWGGKQGYDYDIESGGLYPGLSADDSTLRWGFIRKVYGILTTQIVLTAIVASVVVFSRPVAMFFVTTPGLPIFLAFLPLILLCVIHPYRQSHPINLILLGIFTVCLSLPVGISCAFTRGDIVLEALILTAAIGFGLTAYTYWAAKRGQDFSFLGPFLFVAVIILILWGLIQSFFPITSLGTSIYAGIGALIFSAYIVYDTDNLIKRFDYDDYVWASIALYLDILNLFLALLQLLRQSD